MRKFSLVAAAAATAAFALAAPASAQEDVSVQVDVSDLDLSSPAGAAERDRRVAIAARRACGAPDSRTVTAYAHVAGCRSEAINRALGR